MLALSSRTTLIGFCCLVLVHLLICTVSASTPPASVSSYLSPTTGSPPSQQLQILHQQNAQLLHRVKELEERLKYAESDIFKAEVDYYKNYYAYRTRKSEMNISQFEWQQYASEYLLWLVVIVVVSGIVFSGYQLWKASSIEDLGKESSIELSVQKIKVTSSVVGVVVLAISIIFLYLFLIEVYRVEVIDITPAEFQPPKIESGHIEAEQATVQ